MKRSSKLTTLVIYSTIFGFASGALVPTVLGGGPQCRHENNGQARFEATAAAGRDLQSEGGRPAGRQASP